MSRYRVFETKTPDITSSDRTKNIKAKAVFRNMVKSATNCDGGAGGNFTGTLRFDASNNVINYRSYDLATTMGVGAALLWDNCCEGLDAFAPNAPTSGFNGTQGLEIWNSNGSVFESNSDLTFMKYWNGSVWVTNALNPSPPPTTAGGSGVWIDPSNNLFGSIDGCNIDVWKKYIILSDSVRYTSGNNTKKNYMVGYQQIGGNKNHIKRWNLDEYADACGCTPFTIDDLFALGKDEKVLLTWSAPRFGGSPISDYKYEQDGDGTWHSMGVVTSYTVSPLNNGTAYVFRVKAINEDGDAPPSPPANATPSTVPNAPPSLIGTAGNKEIILNWTAPSDDGGAAITSYQYKKDTDAWVTIPGVLATNYTVTGLSNATSYIFAIRAVNSIGSGTQSSSTTVATNAAQTLTWSSPLSVGNWLTCCSSADGTIMAAGNSTTNIYTSIDSGLNWSEETSSFLGCSSIACSADGLKLVAYCNTPDYRIWTALDSGSGYVWTEHTTGWPSGDGNMINVHLASSADGIKLAATSQWPGATGPSSSARYIYTSADSGANWTTALNTEKQWYDITSNSSGTELAAVTWFDNIWVSHDSGATWTETIPRPATSWLGISYSADASVLAAVVFSITVGGVDGTIWLSNDQGATWFKPTTHPVLSGPPKWYSISVSSDGSKLTCVLDAATTTDYAIWHSFDGGITWSADTGNPPGTGILGRDIASSSTQNTEVVVGGSEIWVGIP